ncbi:hypothetical protein [Brytella acorum]|uniref:Uncharacterized protein n=1 Tax=Brytella acorum TaxID=2959299 RepID=A0AA35XYH3_9PROT|nr:hypothetical protein [Brytella acorum]MDF3623507.1 hypothetical protein [Brytella acorum]CAI9121360.1 hypothetical protein LMG32879_002207 [Brytella acorum]
MAVAYVRWPSAKGEIATRVLGGAHLAVCLWSVGCGADIHAGILVLDPFVAAFECLLALRSLNARPAGLPAPMLGALSLLVQPGPLQALLAGLGLAMGRSEVAAAFTGWRGAVRLVALILLGVVAPGTMLAPIVGLVAFLTFAPCEPLLGSAFLLLFTISAPAFWVPSLICGFGVLALAPRQILLSASEAPVLMALGVALAARRADLAETSLAAFEAFFLFLGNHAVRAEASGRPVLLMDSVLPGAAGFLPFWLALHAVCGLAAALTNWIAGALVVGLALGIAAVQRSRSIWLKMFAPHGLGHDGIRLSLLAGIAAFPGAFFMLLRAPLERLSGASPAGLSAHGGAFQAPGRMMTALWMIPGGDGARWYPGVATLFLFVICGLLTSGRGIASARPSMVVDSVILSVGHRGGAFSFGQRRFMARARRWAAHGRQWLGGAARYPLTAVGGRATSSAHRLALWLLLVALGLAAIGWEG